jgi:curved DNA-binding protein CbpA
MVHLIQSVFGKDCDLYDVLTCPRDANKATLRKSYYRAALKFHPDRNQNDSAANQQFQAISEAYQILKDEQMRAEYDETGVIPDMADDDDMTSGADQWYVWLCVC